MGLDIGMTQEMNLMFANMKIVHSLQMLGLEKICCISKGMTWVLRKQKKRKWKKHSAMIRNFVINIKRNSIKNDYSKLFCLFLKNQRFIN